MSNATRSQDGRYSYEGKWERLCTCGHTLATHTALAPHTCNENGDCGCNKFKLAKSAQSGL